MTTAIKPYRPVTPAVWNLILSVGPIMKESRLFGISTDAQAVAILLKGYELGLSFTSAFDFVHIIEGKPSLSPRGSLALVLSSTDFGSMDIHEEPNACRVTLSRKNGLTYTATFTMEDAKRAGLIKPNSGWERYPSNMLRWRAIGYCIDVVFPDVVAGMKRSDELGGDLSPEGDIVDGNWSSSSSVDKNDDAVKTPVVNQSSPTEKVISMRLSALVKRFGPDAILKANQGKFPDTSEQLDAIEDLLSGDPDVDFSR